MHPFSYSPHCSETTSKLSFSVPSLFALSVSGVCVCARAHARECVCVCVLFGLYFFRIELLQELKLYQLRRRKPCVTSVQQMDPATTMPRLFLVCLSVQPVLIMTSLPRC